MLWLRRYVRLGFRTDAQRLIRMAKESMAYWGLGLLLSIYLWIDTAMLSLMTNPSVVGWYGVTTRLLLTSMFVPVVLSAAWLPRLVSVFERAPHELQREARTPTELVFLLGIPIAAGIAAASGPLIRLVYGPAYNHAIPVLVILGLCVPPTYLNIMVSQVLIAAKRTIVWTWVMGGATVLNPALNAVLIPVTQHRFGNGAIGAAVSLVATEWIICSVGIAIAGRGVLGREPLRRIGLVTVASAGLWCVSFLLRGLGAAPALTAGCVTLMVLVIAFRVLTPSEIEFVRRGLVGAARELPAPLRRRIALLVPPPAAGKLAGRS
jgi:O-antigen/teichoic acid export membrane protein